MLASALPTILLGFAATATAATVPRQVGIRGDFTLRIILNNNDLSPPIAGQSLSLRAYTGSESLLVVDAVAPAAKFYEGADTSIGVRGFDNAPGAANQGMLIDPQAFGGFVTVNKQRYTRQIVYQGGRLEFQNGGWWACQMHLDPNSSDLTTYISYKKEGQTGAPGCADVDLAVVQA